MNRGTAILFAKGLFTAFRFISYFLFAKLNFFFHNAKIINHKEIFSYIFMR